MRHEVTHYLQHTDGAAGAGAPSTRASLEAEADSAAGRQAGGPISVRGRAAPSQTLAMKTYISTVGGNPYFAAAKKFYKLWEGETAEDVGSYEDILQKLPAKKNALPAFRIVTHASGNQLFLPLLQGAKSYAELGEVTTPTRGAFAERLGTLAHVGPNMAGMIYGWLDGDAAGKSLLKKLGITKSPTGVNEEFINWVVDEYFTDTVNEKAQVANGPNPTTQKEKDDLKAEIIGAQGDVHKAVVAALPKGAAASDVDDLKTNTLATLKAKKWKWPDVDAGFFKERLDQLKLPDVKALRRAVRTDALAANLAKVKDWVSDKTEIEIRGCNIGKNDAFLEGIRGFFGTAPSKLPKISAPKLYQFFGTPGLLVLPQGNKQPAVADSLKFLFEETFDDTSVAADVEAAVKTARLDSVPDLAKILQIADIKAQFETWWRMKQAQTASGTAGSTPATPTLQDFRDFIVTQKATFPVNVPGLGAESIWHLVLLPSTAIETILAWVQDQGYTLPAGSPTPLKKFFKGSKKFVPKTITEGIAKIFIDWLGDNYPVPDNIIFPEDPAYAANIRRLP